MQGFLIAYTDDDEVVIAVNHHRNLTNMYISDKSGIYYGLAIDRIKTSDDYVWLFGTPTVQFKKFPSMPGTYVAMQLNNDRIPRPITKISYNKGGRWHPIRAPTKDYSGQVRNCVPPRCSLHLQFSIRRSAVFYSSSSSPGLIIALGNLGSYLGQRPISMYISHDGGYTWKATPFRYVQYTALDHGSVIVAAGYDTSTSGSFIYYSCNGGIDWIKLKFSNEKIRVSRLIVEPGFASLFATVYGMKRSKEWVLARLNFTSVLNRKCQISDYKTWIPRDPYGYANCTLGKVLSYQIRKPESCCYNGQNFVRSKTVTICPCSVEDFECNYGFNPTILNCSVVAVDRKECDNGAKYFYASRYRKISGNQCIKGVETQMLAKSRYSCNLAFPPAPTPGKYGYFIWSLHAVIRAA